MAEERKKVSQLEQVTDITGKETFHVVQNGKDKKASFDDLKGFIGTGGGGGTAPTKVSELENDLNFVTRSDVPSKTSQLINNSGFITVNEIPTDEEDLTISDRKLKFKDRTWSNNSLGYVILRKDKTFAEQVTQANTIYEIRYEFDLEANPVTMLDNCVLKFEGGILYNGQINGKNTTIDAERGEIRVSLSGKFNNENFPLTWFGAKATTTTAIIDVTQELTNALVASSATGVPILVPAGTFYHTGVIMPTGSSLIGSSINNSVLRLVNGAVNNNITIINNDCQVSNLTVFGNNRNEYYSDVYADHQGNGICICNGSRFGQTSKECTNTKIFNLKITKCGNNGLAIIDTQKWVHSFHDLYITHCGNFGFIDVSSDNNYSNFNISHCENVGLYIKGSRNRYSTFKVFVCGQNHKNHVDGEAPSGVYWQGVRLEGNHNVITAFDIQECGGELLHVTSIARCNYIQTTLDRPGWQAEKINKKFKPYNILGAANTIFLELLTINTYNQEEGYVEYNNYVTIAEELAFGYTVRRIGYIDTEQQNILPYNTVLRTTDGAILDINNVNDILTFNGEYSSKGNFDIRTGDKMSEGVEFSLAYRITDTREDKTVRTNNSLYYLFDPYTTIVLLIYTGEKYWGLEFRNGKTGKVEYSSIPLTEHLDVYTTLQNDGCRVIMRNDSGDIAVKKLIYPTETFDTFTGIRFIRTDGLSNLHVMKGIILNPFDITKTLGTTYPLKNDIYSLSAQINGGNSRPNVNTKGFCHFDTSLNKPIWWTGAKWIDATGASV